MLGNTEFVSSGGGGFGSHNDGWLGMLLVIALLGGRGGFFGHGDNGGVGDIERMQLMMNDNNNIRFNQLAGEIGAVESRGQIGQLRNDMDSGFRGLAREVGQLGVQNLLTAKDAQIANLECCLTCRQAA